MISKLGLKATLSAFMLIGGGAIALAASPVFPTMGAVARLLAAPAAQAGLAHSTQALPVALRLVFYQALAKDAGTVYDVNAKGCATLPKSSLKACFGSGGAHFTRKATALSLRLLAVGRDEALSQVKAVHPVINGNRVSYAHGDLTEWWRVLPIGFEQGFTITKRPGGNGELMLALAASRQDAGAPTIGHSRESGNPGKSTLAWGKLRYGDLVVTDAKGKIVPATLKSKGDRVLIAVNDSHAVYPLTVDPLVWLEQEVTDPNGVADDAFGSAVAVSGPTAIVGEDLCGGFTCNGPGAAYVFTESNGTWTQTQKLTASDGTEGNDFGYSVAFDGTTVLVGAPFATVNGNSEQGAAYVFTESNGTWSQVAELTASDGAAYDYFGDGLALGPKTVLIGAYAHNNDTGAAYVFDGSGATWTQTQELTASDGAAGDMFGSAIALEGTTAFVGATQTLDSGQGAAYVFTESNGTWSQTQKLIPLPTAANDMFGYSFALDGTTVLIGALQLYAVPREPGAAYVFSESNGNWTQTAKLTPSDGTSQEGFGWAVALSSPQTALIGAPQPYNGTTGAVYVFNESGGSWTQTQELSASGDAPSNSFGISLAFSGTTALVGAEGVNSITGAAYFEGQSDLGLNMSAPETVGQGQQYVSQTIATNNASAASPAVSATITVPAAASFISATATQGSCSETSGVVTCNFGQIPGNAGTATANVTLKATGSSGTTINNTASVALAQPALTASAPTQVTSSQSCLAGYTTYTGTLAANGRGLLVQYEAPAGQENAILYAPAGFQLYAVYQSAGKRKIYRIPGNEVHRSGPAGTYTWYAKAGATGGAYTFCLMHP